MNIPVALSEWKIGYFSWSKQITKCNLVFNDELFHVHAYYMLCLPLFNVCFFVVVF